MFFKKILAISPHTDDIELSCGASIAKFIRNKSQVIYIALTSCPDTLVNTRFPHDQIEIECKKSLNILGVKEKNIHIFDFPNKFFFTQPRKIYETLEHFKIKYNPDLIIIPDRNDTHQDHHVVFNQAITVFRKGTSILTFDQPWSYLSYSPNFFIKITNAELDKKIKSLVQYKSQVHLKKTYFNEDFIKGLLVYRGMQIHTKYAEGFNALKIIS